MRDTPKGRERERKERTDRQTKGGSVRMSL
jgi:hypothetical protein